MTNKRVVELAEINDMSCQVRQRRWNWLGHILTREGENDCLTALGWTLEGRRARGGPKLLGGQSREIETKLGGRAGKQATRLLKTESVGHTGWRPYAPTGAIRLNDDDDSFV